MLVLFVVAIGVVLLSVLGFTVWTLASGSHHEHYKLQELQPPDPPLAPQHPPPQLEKQKRTIAKTQTLSRPTHPAGRPAPIRKEQPVQPPPPITLGGCAVGWHADNGQCEKNSLFPNPVDREMMSLNGSTPYQYACGAYVDDPRNLERDSTFLYTYHNNRKLMRDIAVTKQSPIVAAFMDSCVRDVEGLQVQRSRLIDDLLLHIETMDSLDELPEVMGLLHRYDTTLPIELSFELDLLDGTRLIPLIRQSGIFANSIDELKDLRHAIQVAKRFMGALTVSQVEAAQMAKDVVNIELSLASAQRPSEATSILDYIEQYRQRDLLEDWYLHLGETMLHFGNFNLSCFLAATIDPSPELTSIQLLNDLKVRPMWVYSRAYMERFAQLHRTHSLEAWKNYLRHAVLFNLVNDDSPHIDPELHYAYHRNYESRYSLPWKRPKRFLTVSPNTSSVGGKPSKEDALSVRNHSDSLEQCSFISEAYLPVILDDFFLHTRLSKRLRSQARQVVRAIQTEFLNALDDLQNPRFSYFDRETRKLAMEKVKAMHFIIGAPEHWEEKDKRNKEMAELIKAEASFTDNMMAIRHFHMQEQATLYHQHVRSGKAVDRDRLFDGMVSAVNAFYQHQLNTIMISAGLLQPPIFSERYDMEAWYARLGVFVAHEMSHSLDTIGTQFDASGSVNNWISEQEAQAYDQHNRYLVSLYNTFTDGGNRHNGLQTLNENIADQTGFPLALAAARRVNPKLDLEEFFLSYAQLYCEAISEEHERQLIRKQTHSVGSMRVNKVLQQQPEFNEWWPQRPLE